MTNKLIKTSLWLVMTFLLAILSSCKTTINEEDIDYRREMRSFVEAISDYSHTIDSTFLIIPQNGHSLMTLNGEVDGILALDYLEAIDGIGREDLFYGYEEDNLLTSETDLTEMIVFMDLAKDNGIIVLVTDYCSTPLLMADSYLRNQQLEYLSFAADSRMLNDLPSYPSVPANVNSNDILTLSDAKNFLYLINPELFPTKDALLTTLQNTNYDVLIIDLFFSDNYSLTRADIDSLKIKENGGSRLIVAYMSIGEAEDYRYYWETEWDQNYPSWLVEENRNWAGNYKVEYWDKEWQKIIYGNDESYLKMIIDASFDGVYLDIIDAFEYFEENAK